MNRSFDPASLPSLPQLYRASAGALLVAITLTVTTVLPAEYGVDPTGVGTALGLTAMGQLKQAANDGHEGAKPSAVALYQARTTELTLTLNPNQSTEVKATMRAGDQLVYSWKTDGGELYYDFHGDPIGGGQFTSYEKASRSVSEGTFDATFEGLHGWYWKNKSTAPVTLVLKTSGVYRSVEEQ